MQISHQNHHLAIINSDQRTANCLAPQLYCVVMSHFLMKLEERLLHPLPDKSGRFTVKHALSEAVIDTKLRYPIFTFFDPRDVYISLCGWNKGVSWPLRDVLQSPDGLRMLARFMKPHQFSVQHAGGTELQTRILDKIAPHMSSDVMDSPGARWFSATFLSLMLGDAGVDVLLSYWHELEFLFSKRGYLGMLPGALPTKSEAVKFADAEEWTGQMKFILEHFMKKNHFIYSTASVYLPQVVAFASCALWKHADTYRYLTNVSFNMCTKSDLASQLSHLFFADVDVSIQDIVLKIRQPRSEIDRAFIEHGVQLGKFLYEGGVEV